MAQTAMIELEYLMTLHLTPQAPQTIDAGNLVFNVTGGWVEGPKIQAKLVAPFGDWIQVLPSGVLRLDVRGTMVTDDDQLIFITYNGVYDTKINGSPDAPYLVVAPTFRTNSEKYGWLNHLQAVGKMVQRSAKPEDRFTRYDIFGVR